MLCSVLLWLFDLSFFPFFPFFLSFFLSALIFIRAPTRERGRERKARVKRPFCPPGSSPSFSLSLSQSFASDFCADHHEREGQRYQRAQRQAQKGFFFFENNLKFNEMLNSQLVLLQKNDHGSLIWLLCCLIGCWEIELERKWKSWRLCNLFAWLKSLIMPVIDLICMFWTWNIFFNIDYEFWFIGVYSCNWFWPLFLLFNFKFLILLMGWVWLIFGLDYWVHFHLIQWCFS